ncbi:hypothetical protein CI109_103648 [Kwoniella shandongensis]|uniref:DNA replication complex GINS protein SLD5 n=1 Tax=Kwoniella shandongensis TaxID=1734106 RepID=A0A5M6C7H7_9TREE|nr:uncharacterized protein CI109_000659 [Kwoniella shandongensis]KAA5531087.1 hypothetical protein CI109_000659 [Kwoniella shandongensis]
MSFFDDEAEDSPTHGHGGRASSSSRAQSIGASSTSFLDRLRSTVSPSPGPGHGPGHGHGHGHGVDRSRASASIFDESIGGAGSSVGYGEGGESSFGFAPDNEGLGSQSQTDLDLDEMEEMEEMDDVKKMGLVWVRERGTVEIMNWEGDLIDGLFDKLEQQQKMVTTLRSDPQTSEEEHFKLMLVQTEMERVKYLVRSYVRTRLHKIEKYSHYITLTPSIHHLLSGAELSHARRYTDLLHTHFQHSVLDSLPEWLRKMDDSYGDGLSMVTKPNRNVPVLIYCRRDCGEITLEGGERAALARGTTHLVKYKLVDRWINLGWAEVL